MKTNRTLSIIISICMILSSVYLPGLTAFAEPLTEGTCGENVAYSFNSETGALAISGTGAMDDYTGENSVFFNNTSIKTVTVEEGVTHIGNGAFRRCTAMTNISLPATLTSLGNYCFYGCKGLNSATVPNGVTEISQGAFYQCSELQSVEFYDGVTNIKYEAFNHCYNLKDIYFNGIYNDFKSITVSDTLNANECFLNARVHCSDTTINGDIMLSNDLRTLIEFVGNSSQTSVTVPNTVTVIEENAFETGTGLKTVTLLNSVRTVKSNAFAGCTALETVIYWGTEAQWNSISFTTGNENLTGAEISIVPTANEEDFSVRVNDGYAEIEEYLGADTVVNIPPSIGGYPVGTIGRRAFEQSNIISVKIPYGVTRIDDYAFRECGITSIIMPNTLEYIGEDAFSGCAGLTSLSIPKSVAVIDDRAFEGCIGLTSITIPKGVTDIGKFAFCGCNGLTSAYIPGSAVNIGKDTFADCTELATVHIGDGVETIPEAAFAGCTKLKTLTLPCSVRFSPDSFKSCNSIDTVTLTMGTGTMPNYGVLPGLTNYYKYTPWHVSADNIKEIVFDEGIANIGDCTFYSTEYPNLTSITIPNSISAARVSRNAFSGLKNITDININSIERWIDKFRVDDPFSGLLRNPYNLYLNGELITDLVIPDSIPYIPAYNFKNCISIKSVTIPESVHEINVNAFMGCTNLNTVYYDGTGSEWYGIGIKNNNTAITNALIYCSDGSKISRNYYLSVDADTVAITRYTGKESTHSIRAEIGGYPVTGIGDEAFKDKTLLTTLTIPESITRIGNDAFSGCTELTNINYTGTIDGWKAIEKGTGNEVFDNAVIVCSDGNISGDYEFSLTDGNAVITKYNGTASELEISPTIADYPVTGIGDEAFKDNTVLTSVTIPSGITSIGAEAFGGCSALTAVNVPASVTSIGAGAFKNCAALNSVNYPGTKAGWSAVSMGADNAELKSAPVYCSNGTVNNPTGTDTIVIDKVTYSDPVKTLIDYPADKTDREFVIPSAVTTIEENAFKSESLEKVTITKNVSVMKTGSFKACSGLRTVTINDGTAIKTLDDTFANMPIEEINLGNGIETIGKGAFEGTNLERVELPQTTKKIEAKAFANINTGVTVVLPDDVYDIQLGAFEGSRAAKIVANAGSKAIRQAQKLPNVDVNGLGKIIVKTKCVYNGKKQTPVIAVYDVKGKALKKGKDYKVIKYKNNVNAGKNAYITIEGTGNFRGLPQKNCTFTVFPAPASRLKVSVQPNITAYSGKAVAAAVTVVDPAANSRKVTSYTKKGTVRNIGKNTVRLTFTGNYTGSRVTYVYVKPSKVKTKKIKKGRGAFVQKWKKIKGVDGYEVYYSQNKNMSGAVLKSVSGRKRKLKVKKLKSKKRYYVQVRAYKIIDGKKYYGEWSKLRSVKVK